MGIAIAGGDRSVIEYNCLSKMGDYGVNIGGDNYVFDFNEVYDTSYNPDPGCGCSGGHRLPTPALRTIWADASRYWSIGLTKR